MSTQRVADNILRGRSYGEDDRDFHVITTEHEYMIDIGLGVFTTGILSSWWNKQYGDSYPNRNLLNIGDAKNIFAKIYSASESPDYAYFNSWRQEAKEYQKYIHVTSETDSSWRFSGTSNGVELNYDQSDLNLDEYYKYETVDDLNSNTTHTGLAAFDSADSILRIIEMNNFVRLKKIDEPDESQWSTTERAKAEFIRDIKSSKEGCLTWKVSIDFVFNFGSDQTVTKTETVTFKLYLFDDNVPHNNERGAAMSDFTIVGTPLNALGIEYRNGSLVDGEWEAATSAPDTKNKTSGKIKLVYNELTGEWESGTTQIVARLLTDIPASTLGDVDEVYAAGIGDLLDKNNTAATVVATGKAMPISIHNGNPLQWAPVYKEPKGCRTDNKKQVVPVVNIVDRTWSKGETVILNQINGIWIPSPLSDESATATATAGIDGQWDFTYLMTNAEYYFRRIDGSNANTFNQFTYTEYEEAFYTKYYTNAAVVLEPKSNFRGAGYYHITSWDFMGPNIGGNRFNGNALSQTQFAIDTQGNGLGDNQDGKNVAGTFSAPFFGCVFPDGYTSTGIYTSYQNLPANNLNLITVNNNQNADGDFFNDITTGNVFTDNNNNVEGNSADGGMFALDSNLLQHLPADMALNSSPSGSNGRPISDINRIAYYFDISSSLSLLEECEKYFEDYKRYSWIYKQDVSSTESQIFTSAFDLAPKDNSNLEFRPLKTETYALFEHQSIDTVDSQQNGDRGEFGARGWQTVNDAQNPASIRVLNRNLGLKGQLVSNQYDSPSTNSLRYGYHDFEHESNTFKSLTVSPNAKYPSFYWDSTWNNGESAAAIGVIGAVCTLTANTSITFNTINYLGMASWFINGGWYPSWGGLGGRGLGNNNYYNLNTTQLYARVFTQWPRELTVYDHRFFSVHHFNYGVGQLDEAVERVDDVDIAGTVVDIRVPTWDDGSTIDTDTIIYGNSNLRSKSEWNIPDDEGRKRRGKLLPYNYTKKTIGIKENPTSYIVLGNDTTTVSTAPGYDILITNQGTNYSNGDKFMTSGGDGDDILLECEVDNDQKITGFTVLRKGKDFDAADFLKASDVLDGNIVSKISIVPSGSDISGSDFQGYVIRGNVQSSSQLTDQGPQELTTNAIQLTPNPPIVEAGQLSAVQILDQEYEKSLNILDIVSSNNKYDVYLHFHNDISHTFADTWGFSPPAREQVCRLKITPT